MLLHPQHRQKKMQPLMPEENGSDAISASLLSTSYTYFYESDGQNDYCHDRNTFYPVPEECIDEFDQSAFFSVPRKEKKQLKGDT